MLGAEDTQSLGIVSIHPEGAPARVEVGGLNTAPRRSSARRRKYRDTARRR